MNNEIEVGEFVRTIDGFIGIFDRYSKRPDTSIYKSPFNCFIRLQNRKTPLQCHRNYIVKHSKNKIDLIEVGDYVNGKEVYSIGTSIGNFPIISYKDGTFDIDTNIKSIVTKESFKEREYVF